MKLEGVRVLDLSLFLPGPTVTQIMSDHGADVIKIENVEGGEPNREIGARRQLEARRRHDTWDRLPQIKTPTLCCGGRYDGIASPANMERLAGRISGAKLELFEGGHLFLMQDQRAWERIVEFLR